MLIRENVSLVLQAYKAAHHLSLTALSEELGIPTSSLQCYIKSTVDLRADTIELLAEKMCVPLMEMISGPAPEWKRAETIIRAAREFGDLPSEQQAQGIQLFLQLVALFARDT